MKKIRIINSTISLFCFIMINLTNIHCQVLIGDWAYIEYTDNDTIGEYNEVTFDTSSVYYCNGIIGNPPALGYKMYEDSLIFINSQGESFYQGLVSFRDDTEKKKKKDGSVIILYKIDSVDYTISDDIEMSYALYQQTKDYEYLRRKVTLAKDNFFAIWFNRREILFRFKIGQITMVEAVEWMKSLADDEYTDQFKRRFYNKGLEYILDIENEKN